MKIFQCVSHLYDYLNFYHPPTKLREGNVFTGICLSFCPLERGVGMSGPRSLPEGWVWPEGWVYQTGSIPEGGRHIRGACIPDRSRYTRRQEWVLQTWDLDTPPVLTLSEWQLPQHIRLASRQYVFYCNVFLFDNFFQVSDL